MRSGESKSIPGLTGIRGVAACWVLLYHAFAFFGSNLLAFDWFNQSRAVQHGWAGVDLFFVLSGFILMHTHRADFATLSASATRRFAVGRLLRVYPLNLVVLGLILVAAAGDPVYFAGMMERSVAGHPVGAAVRTALLGTAWLPGTGSWNEPTWSLSVELVGYAAFPGLAFLLNRVQRWWHAVAIAAVCLALLAAYQVHAGHVDENFLGRRLNFVRLGSGFCAGAALARARAMAPGWLLRNGAALAAGSLVMAGVAITARPAAPLLPAALAALVFAASIERNFLATFLGSRPALFLGRISFPLYLVHVQVFNGLYFHAVPAAPGRGTGVVLVTTAIAASMLLAWVLHITIEHPSHHLARRWTRPRASVGGLVAVEGLQRFEAETGGVRGSRSGDVEAV